MAAARSPARKDEEAWREAATWERQPLDEALRARIAAAFSHRSNLVVAAAARAARTHGLAGLLPALLEAWERLFHEPVRRDPRCEGKLALAEALAALGHASPATWLRGVRHVQAEPVWGGSEDTAGRLRVRCAEALAGQGSGEAWPALADLLADPLPTVRAGAAQVLAQVGGERAELLLRLRLRIGEPERGELVGDYASALVAAAGERALPVVAELLAGHDPVEADAAALALGEHRGAAALPFLEAAWRQPLYAGDRATLLAAIAQLRCAGAAALLLEVLADATADQARAALAGLRLHRDRPEVVAGVERILAESPDPARDRAWREPG
jgi:hypothetical protein